MTEFSPWEAAAGGVLIGIAAVWLMMANGRVAGVASILHRLLPPYSDAAWGERAAFIAGLVLAPALVVWFGGTVIQTVSTNVGLLTAAGFLVGIGSTVGSGCTSGHGVCGLSRCSRRSMVPTGVFMSAGVLTVWIMRHVL